VTIAEPDENVEPREEGKNGENGKPGVSGEAEVPDSGSIRKRRTSGPRTSMSQIRLKIRIACHLVACRV
jgi:hypothetical protein